MIRQTLRRHIDWDKTYVFVFGSRASGEARSASDYDIGLYQGEKIPLSTLSKIKKELEDSRIPVTVDVVDFSRADAEFKKIALKEIALWSIPKTGLKLI